MESEERKGDRATTGAANVMPEHFFGFAVAVHLLLLVVSGDGTGRPSG